MTQLALTDVTPATVQFRRLITPLGKIRGHAGRLPWIPLIILGGMAVVAILAPFIAPHDPERIDLRSARIPPFTDLTFPLGTDLVGRDMLSRLMWGARTAVAISLSALALGGVIGVAAGLVSGYVGGIVDVVVMRITDAVLGFPTILAAMLIITILGAGMENMILAITVSTWPKFCRIVRGEVLAVKEREFVRMSQIIGVPSHVIVLRHVLPNIINTLMVVTSLTVGTVILLEASLSFLGLGLAPGAPAWGVMVSEGRQAILRMWWLSLFPGLAITTIVMAFNYLGDWLRDYLDPSMGQR